MHKKNNKIDKFNIIDNSNIDLNNNIVITKTIDNSKSTIIENIESPLNNGDSDDLNNEPIIITVIDYVNDIPKSISQKQERNMRRTGKHDIFLK